MADITHDSPRTASSASPSNSGSVCAAVMDKPFIPILSSSRSMTTRPARDSTDTTATIITPTAMALTVNHVRPFLRNNCRTAPFINSPIGHATSTSSPLNASGSSTKRSPADIPDTTNTPLAYSAVGLTTRRRALPFSTT